MSKPIIFADMDGCLAAQGKIWFEKTALLPNSSGLGVYKTISDHDSWAVDTFKKQAHIIIISGDERINKTWAKRRGVPFIFTCAKGFHQDKWDFLVRYWGNNFVKEHPVDSLNKNSGKSKYDATGRLIDRPEGNYYYLGDCIPDLKCMENAKGAFYPADAAFALKKALRVAPNATQLSAKSGQGCFEEMCYHLIIDGVLSHD